jgi:hypothetical protein
MGDVHLERKSAASRASNLSCHILGSGKVNIAERNIRPTFGQNMSRGAPDP